MIIIREKKCVIITNGIYKANNINQLFNVVKKVLNISKEELIRVVKEGRKIAFDNFSIDAMIEKYV